MKQKSLKKVLTTVAILVAMLILAGLTLVGCGNKQNPQPTQLNFNEHFKLTAVETYPDGATVADPTIEGLKNAKIYKTLKFEALKDFKMMNFTFTAKAEKTGTEKVQISCDFQDLNFKGDFSYDFSKGEEQSFRCEYKLPNDVFGHTQITIGQEVTITIGKVQDGTAKADTLEAYTTPLSLFNFVIEG